MTSRTPLIAVLLSGFLGSPLLAQAPAAPTPAAPAAPKPPPVDEAKVKAFSELCQKVQRDVGGVSEQDVLQLLAMSRELGRPFAANLAIKSYFGRHMKPSPALLLPAADNARLAGDFRTAIARYKGYLRDAAPSPEASEAANRLFTALLDASGDADDAYDTIGRFGDKFRQSPAVRRFDLWYLSEARRRGNVPGVAARLATVLSEQLPPEQEKLYFWDDLDWLLASVSIASPNQYDALPSVKRLATLVRNSQPRALRLAFYAANLEYKATAAGKDEPTLDKSFAPVVAAANAYFAALPNVESLRDILTTFIGGQGAFSDVEWNRQAALKRDFFVATFPKLNDADKTAAINLLVQGQPMVTRVATPEQWSTLGIQFPAVVKAADAMKYVAFNVRPDDPTLFAKQAAFTNGIPSAAAATINTLAAGTADLNAGIKPVLVNDSWFLGFNEPWQVFAGRAWPTFAAFPRDEKAKLADTYGGKLFLNFGAEAAKTPAVIFDRELAKNYLVYAWNNSGENPNDKSKFVPHLHALDWVPYNAAERKEVVGPAYDAFKAWAGQMRTGADAAKKVVDDATKVVADTTAKIAADTAKKAAAKPEEQAAIDNVIKSDTAVLETQKKALADAQAAFKPFATIGADLTALEKEFAAAGDPKITDLNKAPDPLSRKLAEAVVASNAKKLDDFIKAGREVYALVREWDTKRVPFGGAALTYLVTNRPEVFDTIDLQVEILTDQINRLGGNATDPRIQYLWGTIVYGRPNWSLYNFPAPDAPKVRKLHAVVAAAITAQAQKGAVNPTLIEWFRGTRRGAGWSDTKAGEDVLSLLIEKKTLITQSDYRIHPSGTATYMWLIANEFPGLATKYPIGTYFDAMFLEEANASKYLDWSYFSYGRDEKKAITNGAATLLAAMADQPLPLGYNGEKFPWSRDLLANWISRGSGADKPQRDAMYARIEAAWGKTRFDDAAIGRAYFSFDADVRTPEVRKAFFDKIAAFTDRIAPIPARVAPPVIAPAGGIEPKTLTDAEFTILWNVFQKTSPQTWPAGWGYESVALWVQDGLRARGRTTDLLNFIPTVWKVQRDTRNPDMLRAMVQFARDLSEKGDNELATVYASSGLDIMGTILAEDTRTALMSARAKALAFVGGTIAVPRSDPRYAIFSAQSDFLTGKFQSAWEGYQSNTGMVLSTFKDLDPSYVIWLIDRNTDARNYDVGEALARQLLSWIEATPTGFDPEIRAGALMSYANIAFARQEYPRARAQYERVASAPEFEGTEAKRMAELRIADVDRVTRQFDKAIERLQKLTRRRDKTLQAEAFYQLAMTKYDQEDYASSSEYLNQSFSIVPNHTNGRILEGKLNLKLKKLMEASQLKVGLTANQKFIVPGQPLKIDLEDKDLAIVGSSTSIEVRVWTDTGDEEYFSLFPFGDSKTKFEGQVPTTLGVPVKNDRVLQLFGNSNVFFELSRKGKPKDAAGDPPVTLTIASDAELHASSGRILTKQELEERALENMIRDRLKMNASYQEKLAMSTIRAEDEVKPGNPLYLRVIDPARSITAEKDTVKVRVTTSSGDVIEGFPLTETEPFSGVFEGQVPTSSGQASAGASDSDEGVSPNFPISAGKYGPWVGLPDNRRPKSYSVDLNDNVTLGKMTLVAGVPGRKLKDFVLQTSLNGKNFNTVATWPKPSEAWDGSPTVDLVRYVGMGRAPSTLADFERYMEETYVSKGVRRLTVKSKNVSGNWDPDLGGLGPQFGLLGGEWYIAHFYTAFYLPKNQFKTFQIDPKAKTANINYLIAIDGQVSEDPKKVAKSLSSGVHRIDVYVYALREAAPAFDLLTDIPEAPFIAPTKPEMFDPAKSPQIKEAVYSAPAKIDVDAAASQFDVTFAPDAHARVVRLVINDFETDAPAISSIKLTNAKGDVVLPTAKDFMDLRRNNVLEIVPGDKITVAYETPTPLTRGKGILETFLHATYSDADVSACFVNYKMEGRDRKAEYVPLRRFRTGDPVSVFIKDPDEDVSDKQDVIKVSVKSPGGTEIQVNAVETDKHSGVFMGTFFPVNTAPARPTEIQLKPDEDLVISYLDKENTNPGIPWLRTHRIEQASYSPPMFRVYGVNSIELPEEQKKTANSIAAGTARTTVERFEVTRSLVATRPDRPVVGEASSILLGGPLIVEVSAPMLALSPQSTAEVYVQTTSGRKAAGLPVAPATTRPASTQPEEEAFDPSAPGTIKVLARPKELVTIDPPPGYYQVLVNHPSADSALDDGRFMIQVPVKLGKLPEKSLVDEPEPVNPREEKTPLFVNGADQVFLGFKYVGPDGKDHWTTRRVNLRSDVLFDITDRHFQETVTESHVGEKFYLRIVEPVKDLTDDKDLVKVDVTTSSGVKKSINLTESYGHSGIFKGLIELVYAGEQKEGAQIDATKLPVAYGDVITMKYEYTDAEGKTATAERKVTVFKGADGRIVPFTKRFKDPNIAVQTQFTIAEAFFELAKKHRDLGQESLSRREIAQGKKLLEEAIRDYPDTSFRAQADYLLANLSAEYAKDAQDPAIKKRYQMDAVTRFGDIVSSFPDGPYAPKAQYKKALVLEQMGEIDQACEEYVKLSYRYPENELVAETIARLGQYFLTKGKEFEEKAQTQTDPVEREKVRIQGRDMFRTAAQVFGRLGVRFPQHHLAGRTTVLSAQAYMRAEDYDKAVEVFKSIIEDTKAEKDLVATSMYWCGDCYMKKNDLVLAYRMFKRVTWDYPESQWAKFARGRLTDEKLVRIEEEEANKR